MDIEKQKNVFKTTIENLEHLNELLDISDVKINEDRFAQYLNNYSCHLSTDDLDEYLASLLAYVFLQKNEIINVPIDSDEKLIIMNYVNAVLEELNLEKIKFEVN